jgi:hypothetical protein
VVEIAPDATGRLRIPMRTAAERRLRAWTGPELQAIAQALAAGRVQHVPRGRSGLWERSWREAQAQAYAILFLGRQRRVKAAA